MPKSNNDEFLYSQLRLYHFLLLVENDFLSKGWMGVEEGVVDQLQNFAKAIFPGFLTAKALKKGRGEQ